MRVTIPEGGSSATHSVPEAGEQVTNPFKVLALDLQQIVLDRTAGPAGSLELAQQCRKIVLASRQPSYHGHDFALLPFLDSKAGCLFLRRSPYLGRGRAGAVFFQLATSLTSRRPIPLGALKESHTVL